MENTLTATDEKTTTRLSPPTGTIQEGFLTATGLQKWQVELWADVREISANFDYETRKDYPPDIELLFRQTLRKARNHPTIIP